MDRIGGAAELGARGFRVIPALLSATACAELRLAIPGGGQPGTRNLLELPLIRRLADRLTPAGTVAVQCTFFEKSVDTNWLVPPHRDRCVPVARKTEHRALGPWSVKEGQLFVVAPEELLARMVAVRIHLDPCGPDDGPLRVYPPGGEEVILAEAGDALVMRPDVVHASSKASGSSRRRVLHFRFGPIDPGYGLEW